MAIKRIAYADPPYPGCAHRYRDHKDFDGEVDHTDLLNRLQNDYDGWVLHTSSTSLRLIVPLLPEGSRICAWTKSFAAFKRNVPVAYAWEPVIVRPCRKPIVTGRVVMRDWFECPITLKRGLVGAKPEAVCMWVFEVLGCCPGDELIDLYPGTGAVSRAWSKWEKLFEVPIE